MLCIVETCEEKTVAKGLCRKHYNQKARKGYTWIVKSKPLNQSLRKYIERDLSRVVRIYDNAIGISARLRWRREIEKYSKQLNDLILGIKSNHI